jgi:hypothetical protein
MFSKLVQVLWSFSIEYELVTINEQIDVLLFRESVIHFWEDKISITRINEQFGQLSRVAQNFRHGVRKDD